MDRFCDNLKFPCEDEASAKALVDHISGPKQINLTRLIQCGVNITPCRSNSNGSGCCDVACFSIFAPTRQILLDIMDEIRRLKDAPPSIFRQSYQLKCHLLVVKDRSGEVQYRGQDYTGRVIGKHRRHMKRIRRSCKVDLRFDDETKEFKITASKQLYISYAIHELSILDNRFYEPCIFKDTHILPFDQDHSGAEALTELDTIARVRRILSDLTGIDGRLIGEDMIAAYRVKELREKYD